MPNKVLKFPQTPVLFLRCKGGLSTYKECKQLLNVTSEFTFFTEQHNKNSLASHALN